MINNLEQVKAIKSPEIMFKKNYTPIVQHQEVLTEVNSNYKQHREIEKGYDRVGKEIRADTNVFQR